MHSRIRVLGLVTLVLSGVVSPSQADLDLPDKVVVVRDFARKRQDLLDTLAVNVPDATVRIEQFRGSEVVLHIEVPAAKVTNKFATDRTLRRHCDKVIRKAYPGMTLAASSRVSFVDQRRGPKRVSEKVARLSRQRSSRAAALPPEVHIPSGIAAAAKAADRALADVPKGKEDSAEKAGYLESLRLSTEHRYQKLLARAKGKATPPPVATRPPRLASLSPETTEQMARFPAVAAPAAKGLARSVLADRAKREQLLSRIRGSGSLSPETQEALKRGAVSAPKFSPSQSRSSTYNTVRGIYSEIFAERSGTPEASPGRAADASGPPRLASRSLPSVSASSEAHGSSPAENASDGALSDKIAALFDSVKRSEEATN